MSGRLRAFTNAEFGSMWDDIARRRKASGDLDGAKFARWNAKSWRAGQFPTNLRPEDMKP